MPRSLFLAAFVIQASILGLSAQQGRASEQLVSLLNEKGAKLVEQAKTGTSDGKATFRNFVTLISRELEKQGDGQTARRLREALPGKKEDIPRTEFAWIIHTFAREFYRDEIIRTTGELVRFRTFATDVPNRENPEFMKQKEYLRDLAIRLGLGFNDVGGYVQEIWVGEGSRSFGIMSHSDVQPVEPSEWSHDPWSGKVIDGSIWGRGSVDDKGPICAVMYGMRALLDSGLPLRKKIILLVGTDEESANEDVTTYLQTNAPPDQTIVVDSNFPVVCAEKGWCGIWLHLPRGLGGSGDGGLRIVNLHSGFSPSIVPEKATAHLLTAGVAVEKAAESVRNLAGAFMEARSGSRLEVVLNGDTIVVTARGRSVHSSVPATGHNALMDLLVFLDRDVQPLRNEFSLMAKFAAQNIGFELDGKTLGIAHHDDFMGDMTVAANMFQTSDTTVMFMFNFRRPKGLSREEVESALASRFRTFEQQHGVKFADSRYIGEPHYTDPATPFVQQLLGIYNGITGENRRAQSVGGGTYAQRLPNAVVFGPAMPDEEYLGHQPDERFRISTLLRNIEILTHAMVEFGM
jgi:predicted dipeptidase